MADLIADVGARSKSANEHALAVRSMFDRISPTYDLLNRVLSVGIDQRWRRRALQLLARDLVEGPLLDSCTGTLDLAHAMARSFEGRRVVAADFAREMMVRGRSKVGAEAGLAVADAMRLPFRDGTFAGMTCAFGMRNLANTEQGLREACRVLKPGGTFVVLEFYRPSKLLMRAFHSVYARIVLPMVGSLVSRDTQAYGYLAKSMQGFYTRSEFERLGAAAGFSAVEGEDLTFGIASLVRFVK